MFSLNRRSNAEMPQSAAPSVVERNRRAEDKYAHLEKLAAEKQVEVLANKDAEFRRAVKAHEADAASYKFECSRWGTFLNINVARSNPKKTHELYHTYGPYYSGAINLEICGVIRFEPGHTPDCEGVVTYAHYDQGQEDAKVQPNGFVYLPESRPLFVVKPPPERGGYGMECFSNRIKYEIKLKTPNMPRAALDDQIKFDDIHATLYCPAGMGEGIYKRILKATAKVA